MSYPERRQKSPTEQLSIHNLRRELLTRDLSADGQALARTEPFFRSLQPFSHQLAAALTTEPIFKDAKTKTLLSPAELAASLDDAHLTSIGRTLKKQIAGRDFIDLGCGHPDISQVPRIIADAFGAKRYIGVDKYSVEDSVSFPDDISKMPTYYLKEDMLSFVSQLSSKQNGVFYLGGIEPVYGLNPADIESVSVHQAKKHDEAEAYTSACLSQIATVTHPGDLLIIGQGTHRFAPSEYGFELTEQITARSIGMTDIQRDTNYNIATFYNKIKQL